MPTEISIYPYYGTAQSSEFNIIFYYWSYTRTLAGLADLFYFYQVV